MAVDPPSIADPLTPIPSLSGGVLVVGAPTAKSRDVRRVLEHRGLRVGISTSLQSALRALDDGPSCVVVWDDLPDGDAVAFARAARERQFDGAVVLLSPTDRPETVAQALGVPPAPEAGTLREQLRAFEEAVVRETYEAHGQSPKRAAAALGIDRVTLWRKLRSYQTDPTS